MPIENHRDNTFERVLAIAQMVVPPKAKDLSKEGQERLIGPCSVTGCDFWGPKGKDGKRICLYHRNRKPGQW